MLNCVAQSPNWVWAKSAGGSSNDEASSAVVDASGNTYVTGYFASPTITFGTTTLTNYSGHNNFFLTKYSPTGNVLWVKSAIGIGDDKGTAIAIDSSGGIYVAGNYTGQYIIFGENATDTLISSDSLNYVGDIFLTKFDSNGNIIWAKSAGGNDFDNPNSISTDTFGNIFVTGNFLSNSLSFDSYTLISNGPSNIFIAKYDSTGNVLWAKSAGGMDSDKANSVATDANGNAYIAGTFQDNSITFGTFTLSNTGNMDAFIVKYDTNGNVLWAKNPSGTNYENASSVTTDASGSIYITGYYNSPNLLFETTYLAYIGNMDIFIVKYSTNGSVIWAKNAGGLGFDKGNSIAINSSGNICLAGWFNSSSITFGSDTLIRSTNISDIFLAIYSQSGNALCAKSVYGGSTDIEYSITLDNNGSTMVGYFQNPTITFGNTTLTKIGGNEIFVAKTTEQLSAEAGNNITLQCGETAQLNVTSDYSGTGVVSYLWSPSAGLNYNNISNPIASILNQTTYYVTITTTESGTATDSVTIFTSPLSSKEICYLEFDTTTSKNSINWSTNLSSNIDSIHIYNEISTNIWNKIGSAPASQSNFIDINSNPFNQSYSYKISILDKCGNETDSSSFHTTITLLATYDEGTNTYGFAWSPYYGLSIANYYLYGITTNGTETLIGSVPGNQYFYNYTNPYLGFVKYFIGFNTPVCLSKLNHLVKSNYVHATTGIKENLSLNNQISIFPNPVIENLKIETSLTVNKAEITDFTGKMINSTNAKIINCKSLTNGIYYIKIYTNNGIVTKKFVKQ
jgi:hypothetical protein